LYEIRLLLAHHLGSQTEESKSTSLAAHLAYALHNEAEAIVQGRQFDSERAFEKIRALDAMFNDRLSARIAAALSGNT